MHEAATAQQHTGHAADYSSNPLHTVKAGLRAFWQHGKQALAGLVAIEIALAFVAGVALIVALLAVAAILLAGIMQDPALYTQLLAVLPQGSEATLLQLNNTTGAAGVIALIAAAIGTYLACATQAIYYAYSGAAVLQSKAVQTGAVVKQGFKRAAPLFAQTLLLVVTAAVLLLGPAFIINLISPQAPAGTYFGIGLLAFAVIIAMVLVLARLMLAPIALVNLNMGPLESLKYSWRLTEKRVWELAGILAVVTAVFLVIDFAFTALQTGLKDAPAALLVVALFELVVSVATGLIAVATLTQMFKQAQTTYEAKVAHKANTWLNVAFVAGAIVVTIIVGSLQTAMLPKADNADLEELYNSLPGSSLYDYDSGDSSDTPYLYQ